jgi:hypothetical protein
MTSASLAERQPEGFGGWFVLLIVVQVISLLFIVYLAMHLPDAYSSIFGRFPIAVIGEFLLNAALIVVVLITTLKMFQKSRDFRTWYSRQYWVGLAIPAIDWVWIAVTIAVPPDRYTGALALQWLIRFVVVGFLVMYVNRSRRVENTFVQ